MKEKTRILIVDDEPINLDFFDVMLSKLGFEVEKAEDGEEALKKVVEFHPDLMLLDNIMPKLSGWEVTRFIKRDDEYAEVSDTPIIMFSAMDDVRDKVEGFELGVDDYIIKPFNFSEVLARIRAVLRHRTLSRQVIENGRRMAEIESLNQTLVYFARHLKDPVSYLRDEADALVSSASEETKRFATSVRKVTGEVIAALEGIEEDISERESAAAGSEESLPSIEALEEKFQKHFENLGRERQKADRTGK